MIGNVKVTLVSYDQFCRRLRKLCGDCKPTRDRLYAEWCKCLEREGNIDYQWHANNITQEARR